MTNKTKWKLEDIPKVNRALRQMLLKITASDHYRDEIQSRGLPFFTEEELVSIETEFKDPGMTRKDIMDIIYKKGWLFKENTLKHYIQRDLLPRSLKRVKTDKGMISIYPNTMIRHLNFVRYFLFSGDETINFIKTFLKTATYDDKTFLETQSLKIDDSGDDGDDCFHSVWIGLTRTDEGLAWVEESIELPYAEQDNLKSGSSTNGRKCFNI